MGYLKSIGTSFIYIGAFLAAVTFIPGIPPDAKFTEYSLVLPKELSKEFDVNGRLNDAEILFKGQVKGPEAFASYNGELYTGVHGGYVVKITKDKLVPVVKFGKECDGIWQEAKCGRPLGLKFDKKGTLYVSDAYYGIFKVDVKTRKYEQIISSKEPIEGKVPMIPNSLDIASNGDIYWSDSSTEFSIQDGAYSMMANPSGRLIRYDAATKKNQVLVHDLGFPNGVALSEDESFVIVLETLMSRVTRYNLKGPKAGKREIFAEALPGLPDNVHPDNNNGFLISLVVHADSQYPQLSQALAPHPYIRRMAARLLTLLEAPFKCLHTYYPNYYAEKIVHYIGGFESMLFLSPKMFIILRMDNKGNIVEAAYNTDNKVSGISSAYIHNEYLWLGSPFSEHVARIPLKQAFPKLVVSQKSTQSAEQTRKEVPKVTTSKPTTTKTTTTTPKPNSSESNDKKTSKAQPSKKVKNSSNEK